MNSTDLIRELIAIYGPPGQEEEIRSSVAARVRATGHEVRVDAKGNLRVETGDRRDGPAIVVTAHLDELALMVSKIDRDGRVRVAPLGGAYPWKWGEGPVDILAGGEKIPGILSFGGIHTNASESVAEFARNNPLGWDRAWIFTALDREELAGRVRPGMRVVLAQSRRQLTEFGPFVSGCFLDDRADLAVWLQALERLQEEGTPLPGRVVFAATTSEEVGGHGAQFLLGDVRPDVCVALEIGPTSPDADFPIDSQPTIWVKDTYAAMESIDADILQDCCAELDQKPHWQYLSRGGSDASCSAAAGLTARPVTLGLPVENSHGHEIMHRDAPGELCRLLLTYLRRALPGLALCLALAAASAAVPCRADSPATGASGHGDAPPKSAGKTGKGTGASLPSRGGFLQVRGTSMRLGKFAFDNVGMNIPDLFERFLHGQDASGIRSLQEAKKAGVRAVRFWGTVWGPAEFGIYETDRARWLGAFDRTLAACDAAGIYAIPSLLFNINMVPDYVRQKRGGNDHVVEELTPGTASNDLANDYVATIAGRYAKDMRVLMWEIGNEFNLEADLSLDWKQRPPNEISTSNQIRDFLIQIAKRIKSVDSRHPVTSGNADMRPYAWHIHQAMLAARNTANPLAFKMDWTKDTFEQYREMLGFFNPAPLDVICVHCYPPGDDTPNWLMRDDTSALQIPWTRTAADQLGKPLLVGECGDKVYGPSGEPAAPWLQDFLRRIGDGQAQIALVWSWEFGSSDPGQNPYTLSPERTPKLVGAITQLNENLVKTSLRSRND
jgi:putative aminopeptidase FrvX